MINNIKIRPTWAEVDLDSFAYNIRQIKNSLDKGSKLMAVVKANAYGHGMIRISRTALKNGVEWLGVALIQEAVELRENDLNCPILVMGGILPHDVDTVIKHDISQTVFTGEVIQALDKRAASEGKKAKVHLKIDTGMSRLGVRPGKELEHIITVLRQCSHIYLEGVFTHFSVSDIEDKEFTRLQFERFNNAAARLREEGMKPDIYHCCNSGAVHDCREMYQDMVRPGISIYGYYPSEEVKRDIRLMPILSWKTRVVYVREVPAGTGISYGRTFITKSTTRVATIPVGYGDGYSRALSNKGQVIVKGRKVPVIGRVCMDQCMIDVTGIDGIKTGEPVVLLGNQGNAAITADDLAGLCDTISHEILTGISQRVPRVYIEREHTSYEE